MAIYTFAVPIVPGKTETWLKYMHELKATRWDDFVKAMHSVGARSAQARLQRSPMGDFSVVWVDVENPTSFFEQIFKSDEPVLKWFREKVLIECEGAMPDIPPPDRNELILDISGQGQPSKVQAFAEARKK